MADAPAEPSHSAEFEGGSTGTERGSDKKTTTRRAHKDRDAQDSQSSRDGIKAFAAAKAKREESQRFLSEASNMVRAADPERARREFADAARSKVENVVKLMQRDSVTGDSKAGKKIDEEEDGPSTLEELQAEKRLMTRLGFNEKAQKIEEKLQDLREEKQKKKSEQLNRILKQRISVLETTQRAKKATMEKDFDERAEVAEKERTTEVETLLAQQGEELQQLVETVTRAAAFEEVELPAALVKLRYRPSNHLVALKENVDRLEKSGKSSKFEHWKGRAKAMADEEKEAWRSKFLQVALGTEPTSVISQIQIGHKVTHDKLLERHAKQRANQEKARVQEITKLEGAFRLERWKAIEAVKKQAATVSNLDAMEMAMAPAPLVQGEADDAASEVMSTTTTPAPVEEEAEEEIDLGAEAEAEAQPQPRTQAYGRAQWEMALTFWQWAHSGNEVLAHVLDCEDSELLRPLEDYLREQRAVEMTALTYLVDISALQKLDGAMKEDRAIEIYELMNNVHVPGSSDRKRIVAAVEETGVEMRKKLEERFRFFLGTEHCSRFFEIISSRVAEKDASDTSPLRAIPRVVIPEESELFEVFSAAVEDLPMSVILVDMTRPGLPNSYVNKEFERLTGYSKRELVGVNCRILQGPFTEDASLSKLVESIRYARPCSVMISNARKDGRRFRNGLSLHPLHDSLGRYRYMIGIACDADAQSAEQLDTIALVLRVLPRTFQASLQSSDSSDVGKRSVSRDEMGESASQRQFKLAMAEFYKLMCFEEPEQSFRRALEHQQLVISEMLKQFPSSNRLKLLQQIYRVESEHEVLLETDARSFYAKLLEPSQGPLTGRAVDEVAKHKEAAISSIANDEWLQFVRSRRSMSSVEALVERMGHTLNSSLQAKMESVLHAATSLEEDAYGWLRALFIWAEQTGGAVTVADVTVAGCPLIYVNQAFCNLMGFSAGEILGKNCRFLQGPESDTDAVGMLTNAVRTGTDVITRIVNYKRDGSLVHNLVFMRPVQDSNKCCRFFVSFNCEIEDASQPRAKVDPLSLRWLKLHLEHFPRFLPALIANNKQPARRQPAAGGEDRPKALESTNLISNMEALLAGRFTMPKHKPCARMAIAGAHAAFFANLNETSNGPESPAQTRFELSLLHWLQQPAAISAMKAIARDGAGTVLAEKISSSFPLLADAFAGKAIRPGALPEWHSFCTQSEGVEMLRRTISIEVLPLLNQETFTDMLIGATEDLPVAVLLTDTHIAGLPLCYVNKAWESLTGYSRAEVLGRNCRFLQGPQTEESVVTQIVQSIREAKPCKVTLTNVRKDGSLFSNRLALRPIRDSAGRYRFMVGVSIETEQPDPGQEVVFNLTLRLLPDRFPCSLQILDAEQEIGAASQLRQYATGMVPLKRAELASQGADGVRKLLAFDEGCRALDSLLSNSAERKQLLLHSAVLRWNALSKTERLAEAHRLLAQHVPGAPASLSDVKAAERIAAADAQALDALVATVSIDALLKSELVDFAVQRLVEAEHNVPDLLVWTHYSMPCEAVGWLRVLATVTKDFTRPLAVADMTIPGVPLIYVNDAWCEQTGYERREALGRNARFLQGPKTEPAAVASLIDAIRTGSMCKVQITNYRKDGSEFQSVLMLRPVHDNNGAYRFCVALSLPTKVRGKAREESVRAVATMVSSLPYYFSVYSAALLSPVHRLPPNKHAKLLAEKDKATLAMLFDAFNSHFNFNPLPKAAKEDIVNELYMVKLAAKQPFIRSGDAADCLYVIHEGSAHIFTSTTLTIPSLVLSKPGTIIGEQAVLSGGPRAGTVTAGTDLTLWCIDKLNFRLIVNKHREDGAPLDLRLHCLLREQGLPELEPTPPPDVVAEMLRGAFEKTVKFSENTVCEVAFTAQRYAQNREKMLAEVITGEENAHLQLLRLTWAGSAHKLVSLLLRKIVVVEHLSAFAKELQSNPARRQAKTPMPKVDVGWLHRAIGHDGDVIGLWQESGCAPDGLLSKPSAEVTSRFEKFVADQLQVVADGLLLEFTATTECLHLIEVLQSRRAKSIPLSIPRNTNWIDALAFAAENLKITLCAVDVATAGLPICYVNKAWESLTGYSRDEVQGRNCRFLQGPQTEESVVKQIVQSIREAKPCQVTVTNTRRNMENFSNKLALVPIHDSTGRYRYVVGVSIDAEQSNSSLERLYNMVLQLLPTVFPERMQPLQPRAPVTHIDLDKLQLEQYEEVLVQVSKSLAAVERSTFLHYVFADVRRVEAFLKVMKKDVEKTQVRLCARVAELQMLAGCTHDHLSETIYAEFLGSEDNRLVRDIDVPSLVSDVADRAFKLCVRMVPKALEGDDGSFLAHHFTQPPPWDQTKLMYGGWDYAPDLVGFLHAFQPITEMEVGVALADMSQAGCPLVYVNDIWQEATGYEKSEAIGRNARFLQGPKTEPEVVKRMIEALRAGVACHERVSNYTKAGQLFSNLLSLRPVWGSNGALRLCVAISTRLSDSIMLSGRLSSHEAAVRFLPRCISVGGFKKSVGEERPLTLVDVRSLLASTIEGEVVECDTEEGCDSMRLASRPKQPVAAKLIEPDLYSLVRWAQCDSIHQIVDLLKEPIVVDAVTRFMRKFYETNAVRFAAKVLQLQLNPRASRLKDVCDRFLYERAQEYPLAKERVENCFNECLFRVAQRWTTFTCSSFCAEMIVTLRRELSAEKRDLFHVRIPDSVAFEGRSPLAERLQEREPWARPLIAAMAGSEVPMAVSDCSLPGLPLIYVNPAWEELTGFSADEAIGRNARFLQGPNTESEAVAAICEALRLGRNGTVRITNYKKSFEPFSNLLSLRHIYEADTGVRRIVVAFSLFASAGDILAQEQLNIMEALKSSLPNAISFSTRAPKRPRAPRPEDEEVLQTDSTMSTDTSTVTWVGAPIRRHLAALRGLMRIEEKGVRIGRVALEECIAKRWVASGKIDPNGKKKELSALDFLLTLSSDSLISDAHTYFMQALEMLVDLDLVLTNKLSGEERTTKLQELVGSVIKSERAALKILNFASDEARQKEGAAAEAAARNAPKGPVRVDPAREKDYMEAFEKHTDLLLRLVLLDAWLEFLRAPESREFQAVLKQSPSADRSRLDTMMESCRLALPTGTEEWMRLFISATKELPIGVIAYDMTLAGAPVIYANDGFERISGYTPAEVIEGECPVLASDKAEAPTLAKVRKSVELAMELHVQMSIKRKDGASCLLMVVLHPVFDEEGLYRFMLTFLIECHDAFLQMKARLMQVDRLLKLSPDKLPLPSPPGPRERATLYRDSILALQPTVRDWDERVSQSERSKAAGGSGAKVGAAKPAKKKKPGESTPQKAETSEPEGKNSSRNRRSVTTSGPRPELFKSFAQAKDATQQDEAEHVEAASGAQHLSVSQQPQEPAQTAASQPPEQAQAEAWQLPEQLPAASLLPSEPSRELQSQSDPPIGSAHTQQPPVPLAPPNDLLPDLLPADYSSEPYAQASLSSLLGEAMPETSFLPLFPTFGGKQLPPSALAPAQGAATSQLVPPALPASSSAFSATSVSASAPEAKAKPEPISGAEADAGAEAEAEVSSFTKVGHPDGLVQGIRASAPDAAPEPVAEASPSPAVPSAGSSAAKAQESAPAPVTGNVHAGVVTEAERRQSETVSTVQPQAPRARIKPLPTGSPHEAVAGPSQLGDAGKTSARQEALGGKKNRSWKYPHLISAEEFRAESAKLAEGWVNPKAPGSPWATLSPFDMWEVKEDKTLRCKAQTSILPYFKPS